MAWGSTQDRTYRHWSTGAIECYERNCVCKGCPTFDLIGKQCKMKQSVLSLIRNVGLPDTEKKQQIINDENIKVGQAFCLTQKTETAINNVLPQTNRKGKIEITKHVCKQKDAECNVSNKNRKENKTMYDKDLNLEYPNYCAKLIDAVKKGYESYDDLEKASETSKHNLSVYFGFLHKALLKKGLIQQSQKTHKQAVIDFIQSRLCDTNYMQNKQPVQKCEQNTPPEQQPQVSVTKSAMISRIADLSEQCTALMSENEKLRERIKELENQPKQTVDFSAAKQKLHAQIEQLQTQLDAIRIAERMMNESEVK